MTRPTLADLYIELRSMTEAGTADYTLNGETYWDDATLHNVLDSYRKDIYHELLTPVEEVDSGGTAVWKNYYTGYENLENTSGGTSIFYVQDAVGDTVGTANYSTDYQRGVVAFVQNTGGSTYYFTGRSYDLNAAAADIWRRKASHTANAFSFSTDNHRVDRGKLHDQYIKMAEMYENRGGNSVTTIQMWRNDTDV